MKKNDLEPFFSCKLMFYAEKGKSGIKHYGSSYQWNVVEGDYQTQSS